MPNIAITKYCNLKCPYCFAHTMLTEEQAKNISIEQLKTILSWLSKSSLANDHLGLIGGEPTLHPNFMKILFIINEFCDQYDLPAVLFTNGIELKKYLCALGSHIGVLVNVNKLDTDKLNQLYESLDAAATLGLLTAAQAPVSLGCNLFMEETDYSYFWDVVDRYPGITRVRMSVTAPIKEEYQKNKDMYYNTMKPIFWQFLLDAFSRDIKISFDCNLIPLCYFSEEEQQFIKSMGQYKDFCSPTVDITADFCASSCFGTYTETLIDCNQFESLDEVKRYFSNQMMQKSLRNCGGKCAECKKNKLLQCQGGCLSFSL